MKELGMKFSGWRFCALVSLISVVSLFFAQRAPHAQPTTTPTKKSKVIIYPSGNEKMAELKDMGIGNADDYGPYWVAAASDGQFDTLKKAYGDRAAKANYLNRIELSRMTIDTSGREPVVPSLLTQKVRAGKRLRLIQFRGPVVPQWLEQVKAAGDVTVVSYIPNNAYLLWLDARAEQKLSAMSELQGPIQWMGAYHPYYKISQELFGGSGVDLVKVRVAVVDDVAAHSSKTEDYLQKIGFVEGSYSHLGQEILQMKILPATVSRIAQFPDVLWIEKIHPTRILDEVQGLTAATQTNQLPLFSPTPPLSGGLKYLDFLKNTVGGGLLSFTDPSEYPVVDIADTGLDNGTQFPFHPAFYFLGNPFFGTRVAYLHPGWLAGNPVTQLGCTTRLSDNFQAAFRPLETADLDGHGTLVASILAGYDTGTNLSNVPFLELLPPVSNTVPVTIDCANISNGTASALIPNGFTNVCLSGTFTNVTYTGLTTNNCPTPVTTNTIILYTAFRTNHADETRVDANGFQKGMGISPFGAFGVTRVWGTMESGVFSLSTVDNVCLELFRPSGRCINLTGDLLSEMSIAYVSLARIQNNSWGDAISTVGDNGGVYNDESQIFDFAVRDVVRSAPNAVSPLNQEFIVVFACNSLLEDAGSQGNAGGFAESRVTAPATAKNVISVGSSVNPNTDCGGGSSLDMYFRSAPGRQVDNRFKPEIVAPGAGVEGALVQLGQGLGISGLPGTNCSIDKLVPFAPLIIEATNETCTSVQTLYTNLYTCASGSSYAAPAVSGAIQLLWWYFEHRLINEFGQHLSQPSPAMAKAYLCNSARYLPITNPESGTKDTLPSILQGMGELDLQRMFDGMPRVLRDESSPRAIDVPLVPTNRAPQQTYFTQSGQTYGLKGKILSNDAPFRVTVAWTDAPGTPFSNKALMNDLNLQVTVGGVAYKGNSFSEDHSVVLKPFDTVNNLESVFLPSGGAVTAGAPYEVRVIAQTIAADGVTNVGPATVDQDFALVVYNSGTGTFGTPSATSDAANFATNDTCQTAIVISNVFFSFTNSVTTSTYSDVHPTPAGAGSTIGGPEEFFKLLAPVGGIPISVVCNGTNSITSLWRGGCGALEEVASTVALPGRIDFTADGTNDYYIIVDGKDGGDALVQLNVTVTCPVITISPSSLPDGNIGQFYDQSLTATNGTAPYKFTKSSGSLPPGLFLSDVGVLSGVPTTSGSFTFSVTVTDFFGCTSTATYTFAIICPTISLLPVAFPDAAIGFPYSQTNTAVGGAAPYVFTNSAGSLPAGITYSNGVLSGTPTTTGSNSFTVTVTDSFGCTTNRAYILTVIPPSPLVCLSSGTIAFGSVNVGATSAAPQSVTVTNCGTTNLSVTAAAIGGANASDFHITTNSCSSVATSSTCSISIDFTPTTNGVRVASLAITDTASGSPHLVSLTGSGTIVAFGRPDAAIGKTTNLKAMRGIGVTSTNGVGEQVVQRIKRGAKHGKKFFVKLKNAGSSADRFTIEGTPDSGTGFRVKYFLGTTASTEVTTAVETAGSFHSSTLAPGAITGNTSLIRIDAFVDKAVPKGITNSFFVTFTSVADPTKTDVVRAIVIAK